MWALQEWVQDRGGAKMKGRAALGATSRAVTIDGQQGQDEATNPGGQSPLHLQHLAQCYTPRGLSTCVS